MTISDEERRRLRAIQEEIMRTGDPETPEGIDALGERLKSIAATGQVDPELRKKQELARQLAKWRRS